MLQSVNKGLRLRAMLLCSQQFVPYQGHEGERKESEHFMMNVESVEKFIRIYCRNRPVVAVTADRETRMFGVVLLQRFTRWPQIAVTGPLPIP